jgi:hypothetical protein
MQVLAEIPGCHHSKLSPRCLGKKRSMPGWGGILGTLGGESGQQLHVSQQQRQRWTTSLIDNQ